MEDIKAAESTNYGMDTLILHKVYGEQAEEALSAAKEEAVRLEGLLSRFIPSSEICRINQSAGRRQVKISAETYGVLSKAAEFSDLSQGCFDITIGPLVDLWRSARTDLNAPAVTKIQKMLSLINYKDLVLNSSEQSAFLNKKGQSIDLGGIGKGYAADKILEVIKSYGITSAFTNFGGNVAVIGLKPDGSPWRVGIQHPRQENKLIGALKVTDMSVVTSGDYQRFFNGKDGKRYHHILNPATGHPSDSGLISVTIVSENSMTADALSTMLFILGLKRGSEILKTFQKTEAVLIDKDLQVYITKGLQDNFKPGDGIPVTVLD